MQDKGSDYFTILVKLWCPLLTMFLVQPARTIFVDCSVHALIRFAWSLQHGAVSDWDSPRLPHLNEADRLCIVGSTFLHTHHTPLAELTGAISNYITLLIMVIGIIGAQMKKDSIVWLSVQAIGLFGFSGGGR
jgi:hypothetical protein